MIRNIIILVALLCLIGGYTWFDSASRQTPGRENTTPVKLQTQTAPDFTFRTLDGEKHALSDYKGKIIVLNFWASWCAPCVVEFPQMVKLAKKTRKETIFLFLSLDDSDEAIERFVEKYAPKTTDNVLIARDADKSIAEGLYQTFKLPETYIIGPDLKIKQKIIGADVDWNSVEMQERIKGSPPQSR